MRVGGPSDDGQIVDYRLGEKLENTTLCPNFLFIFFPGHSEKGPTTFNQRGDEACFIMVHIKKIGLTQIVAPCLILVWQSLSDSGAMPELNEIMIIGSIQ